MSDGTKESKLSKFNIFKHIVRFFSDCKSEIKKVVWPPVPLVFRSTGVVMMSIILVGLFIFLLDSSFYFGLSKIIAINQ